MNTLKADGAVVGGGAAGLLLAGLAASKGARIVLIEPNERLGKKLRITGKGRCNITNDCDAETLLRNVHVNEKFLRGAFARFDSQSAMEFFRGLGIELKTERGGRVFPVSDSANEVADSLQRLVRDGGVKIIRALATKLLTRDEAALGETSQGADSSRRISGVLAGETLVECPAVALCTGGLSYPATGSTGDGYALAASLGHNIIKPAPSLVPMESSDKFCAAMQGLTLKNVLLRAFDESGRRLFEEQGELLFTHFGVSGPLVLSASAHLRDFDNHRYTLSIDLKPGLDERKLDTRLLRDFEKYTNRDFANSLGELAPHLLIPVLVERSGIAGDTKVHSVTKQQRAGLAALIKGFTVDITRPRPIDEAIITSGGVDVKQVDPRTMESKLVRGLYFAGEILDIDAYTGGFNLQIAWSTAYCAAQAIGNPK
jgi:predicted Rossmann fold flavoprotein